MTESTSSAATPTVQSWENSFSPYFLSSGDNPGISLVIQPLTEENYSTWSRAILISLDTKTKLGFIDSSIPKPILLIIPIIELGVNVTTQSWLGCLILSPRIYNQA